MIRQAHPLRPIVHRCRRGAALVELALLLPVLGTIVLGVCEIGQVLRVHASLTEAARKGCATGTLPGSSNADIIGDVQSALSDSGLPTSATITVKVNDIIANVATAKRNDKVSVAVSLPTAQAAWTGSNVFVLQSSVQSEVIVMLKQD